MKQQVLVIHGGTTYANHSKFISDMKNLKIDLEKLKYKPDWKETLAQYLGNDYEVFTPKMPNFTNAKYKEWSIWFTKIINLLNDNIVLVGHSLGGIFLAKYLSGNICPKKIKAVILVAAPFEDSSLEEDLADFALPKSLAKFDKQAPKIYLLQSQDDPIVSKIHLKHYQKHLPYAQTMIFKDKGHFKQAHFAEIVKLIKSL